ncbi:MAG: exonuclease SbcCD subunit D [Clostridia bacterium]|nr:exonuclease SbcCD subunit D [Clostridia bacterium]
MKFLHTSDLHIGLRMCEYSMLADCRHILAEISEIAVREGCEAVIIAGDLYDRAAPSAEAVAVLDGFVSGLAAAGIAVLAVAGNHDSAERVAYLSAVAKAAGVYFSPVYDGECEKVTFTDAYGDVDVWLLPYVRPVNVRAVCEGFEGNRFCEAVEYIAERIPLDPEKRNILVTHHFVVGGEVTEEDELGGAGLVPARIFDGFDYTALGHLHGAHPVGKTCRYSGSPLKHSFNEIGDEKTVSLVELREKGEVFVECVPLHPLRDLREVRGTYDEVVHMGLHDPAKDDYIRVVLTDEEDILDAAVKLRVVYPNLMRLAYDNRRTREYREIGGSAADVPEDGAVRPEDVFAELFELQNNVPPDEELLDVVRGIFETCEEVECE